MKVLIRRALPADVDEVKSFHDRTAGEYIWPRTLKQLLALTKARQVTLAFDEDADSLIGMCYVKADMVDDEDEESEATGSRVERWEFGGVVTDETCRGHGVATTLAKAALIAHFIGDVDGASRPLMAHVHVDNVGDDNPRGLMTAQLGFVDTGKPERFHEDELKDVPDNLSRDDDGYIYGDVFAFDRAWLDVLADWLRDFDDLTKPADRGGVLVLKQAYLRSKSLFET